MIEKHHGISLALTADYTAIGKLQYIAAENQLPVLDTEYTDKVDVYKRQSKEQVHSVLDDIPGIGETRRKALMRRFRSVENIRDASVEELSQTAVSYTHLDVYKRQVQQGKSLRHGYS